MAFFFRRSRTMEELVVILIDDLDRLGTVQKSGEAKPEEETITRVVNGRESPPPEFPPRYQVEGRLAQVKLILIGDGEKQPDPAQCQELAAALLRVRYVDPKASKGDNSTDTTPPPLICRLILSLRELPFECRKDVALIFTHLLEKDENFWENVKLFNLKAYPEVFSNNKNNRLLHITSSLKALLLEGMESGVTSSSINDQANNQASSPETDESNPAVSEENSGDGDGDSDLKTLPPVPDMMKALVSGCGFPEVSLNCGVTIRTAVKDVMVAQRLFKSPEVYIFPFFEASPGSWSGGFLDEMNFDIASDAFATIRDLFTRHKADGIVRDFLLANYSRLFGEDASATPSATPAPPSPTVTQGDGPASSTAAAANDQPPPPPPAQDHREAMSIGLYGGLLSQSKNFFTRRQSLKLLAELLLDRSNFNIMMKFISSKHNLKLVMNLLIDSSKNIQFEAFHVFKVFVANPRKSPEIITALVRNKDRLLKYLEGFHNDRQDAQFLEEKNLIITTLSKIQPVERERN